MTTDAVDEALRDAGLDDERDQLRADLQALADVRTLDEWATMGNEWRVRLAQDGLWVCSSHVGATPDEARAKAAAWVRGLK